MTTTWPSDLTAKILSKAFTPKDKSSSGNRRRKSASDAPVTSIDVLITFDKYGVSSHPNHISLYHGARAWISDLMRGKAGWKCPVELYTLSTTSLLRKYLGFLDAPVSMLVAGFRGAGLSKKQKREQPPSLIFVSGLREWRRGQDAMINGHKSQMVWFRWGWICIGRYMVVNDLKREHVV